MSFTFNEILIVVVQLILIGAAWGSLRSQVKDLQDSRRLHDLERDAWRVEIKRDLSEMQRKDVLEPILSQIKDRLGSIEIHIEALRRDREHDLRSIHFRKK